MPNKKKKGMKNSVTGLFFIIFLIIGLIIFLTLFYNSKKQDNCESGNNCKTEEMEKLGKEKDKNNSVFSILNGLSIQKESQSLLPIAIIIDNFYQARPPSGITHASVVYEAPTEAGITRFLTIFDQSEMPDKIGPVRSARPYFLDWTDEYSPLFVHAGGSPESLSRIKNGEYKIYDLNEISGDGRYFQRDTQRSAPHNLYVSKELMLLAINNKDVENKINTNFIPWKFKIRDDSSESSELNKIKDENKDDGKDKINNNTKSSELIKIYYPEPVIWQYDQSKQVYFRFQSGQPFLDDQGEQIQAKTVIIQISEIEILDSIGRRKIQTQGRGDALIFQQGKITTGHWQKLDRLSRTIFYNQEGNEIEFDPGMIWVNIVGEGDQLLY